MTMRLTSILLGTAIATSTAIAAWAGEITITDSYARSASKAAKSGAAFLIIENGSDSDDRLIGAQSPAAQMVQLHTHKENNDGVMQMLHVEEGFVLPAGGQIMMQRGGDHVMLMGLSEPLAQGATIPVTLQFEKAGEMRIEVPVDNERQPAGGHGMQKTE